MHYVYILKSTSTPTQTYVGYTANLKERLTRHNQGRSKHTAKYIPWELKWYCAFPEKQDALEFETYLKSHSGKAFTTKRLMKNPH
jgi:predicted GIY-YIG superfamily endonuclease